MTLSRPILLSFCFIIFSCLLFVLFHCTFPNNTKHKHLRSISRISPLAPALAPKLAPEAASYTFSLHKRKNRSIKNTTNTSSIFNVQSYGAVGDGVADDTQAFKLAWDTVCLSETSSSSSPPILLVPYGHSFMIQSSIFTGPCKSSLIFQIDGTVKPPDGPDSWPKDKSKRQWLVFYRINGLLMQGDGLIDGRGDKWWNLPCKHHKGVKGKKLSGPCDSPVAIRFLMSSNLIVKGLQIKNSPQFHFRFDSCQNVYIDSLNIESPSLSPNTDGIHIENSHDVKIYNSIITTGDDCVSIGAGCFSVDIKNITCGPSHGISIGSLGSGKSKACVTNITVKHSAIKHSDNGVRIKTWQGGSGTVTGVIFENITMDTVRNPIMIDQYYCQKTESSGCTNQTSAVFISDISYIHIRGTYDVRSPPLHLACSDSIPCTNLTFSDIELVPASVAQRGNSIANCNPFCWNAYGALETITIPPVSCLLEGFPGSIPYNLADNCYINRDSR